MANPENWSQLATDVNHLVVAPAQELRCSSEGALQYVQDGIEYLAISSTKPYGTESEAAFKTPRPAHLLEGVAQGIDYTTFVVPEEALALQALTRGTGRGRAELLGSVYHNVGEVLGNLSTNADARAPLLGTKDVAVDRLTGEVLLLPPLLFGKKAYGAEDYLKTFLKSIDEDLSNSWPVETIESIKDEVAQGVEDGSRTA